MISIREIESRNKALKEAPSGNQQWTDHLDYGMDKEEEMIESEKSKEEECFDKNEELENERLVKILRSWHRTHNMPIEILRIVEVKEMELMTYEIGQKIFLDEKG